MKTVWCTLKVCNILLALILVWYDKIILQSLHAMSRLVVEEPRRGHPCPQFALLADDEGWVLVQRVVVGGCRKGRCALCGCGEPKL